MRTINERIKSLMETDNKLYEWVFNEFEKHDPWNKDYQVIHQGTHIENLIDKVEDKELLKKFMIQSVQEFKNVRHFEEQSKGWEHWKYQLYTDKSGVNLLYTRQVMELYIDKRIEGQQLIGVSDLDIFNSIVEHSRMYYDMKLMEHHRNELKEKD